MYVHRFSVVSPSNVPSYVNTTAYASEADLIGALRIGQPGAFAALYDQYAPVLLGIITKITGDEQRAESVLARAFTVVCSEIEQCPANQPLFLWLFDIARQTATKALDTGSKINSSVVQLTAFGKVVTGTGRATLVQAPTDTEQRLLNAVLFERCTPQEASQVAGLPTEQARQHLRQAFLKLRKQSA